MESRKTFTCRQYDRLLEALCRGGYRFAGFEDQNHGQPCCIMRHDVDKSPARALEMARLERKRGVQASYFFLLRSRMYNLAEPETRSTVREIAELGHEVGLHCDIGRMPDTETVDSKELDLAILGEIEILAKTLGIDVSRAVTFHNPPRFMIMREPEPDTYISGYAPKFMMPNCKYISESNANWREGDPVERIEDSSWPMLQILVHPIWWIWREAIPVEKALENVVMERLGEIDIYLRHSNDLWREADGLKWPEAKPRYRGRTCAA